MANLKEIKRKIKSVYNTQKTTNAMKLVSTAKLKRAEELARQSRVYANKLEEVMSEIAFKLKQYGNDNDVFNSVFFQQREKVETVDIVFITSDKGLCGGFNIKTLKEVTLTFNKLKSEGVNVRLRAIGKVGVEFFKFQKIQLYREYIGVSSSPNYEKACEIINEAVCDFENGESDSIVLIHNGYKNMISQELVVQDFLPIPPVEIGDISESKSILEIEPKNEDVLLELLKRYFEYNMYYSLVNSLAAEHSARMQAMDNATNNAKARVKELNLAYNKARQESITTELIEIISGVESMK